MWLRQRFLEGNFKCFLGLYNPCCIVQGELARAPLILFIIYRHKNALGQK